MEASERVSNPVSQATRDKCADAKRIAAVLAEVMRELRALREIADASIDSGMPSDAFPNATIAICEHAHVLLDRCAAKLGGPTEGNFDIDARLDGREASHG